MAKTSSSHVFPSSATPTVFYRHPLCGRGQHGCGARAVGCDRPRVRVWTGWMTDGPSPASWSDACHARARIQRQIRVSRYTHTPPQVCRYVACTPVRAHYPSIVTPKTTAPSPPCARALPSARVFSPTPSHSRHPPWPWPVHRWLCELGGGQRWPPIERLPDSPSRICCPSDSSSRNANPGPSSLGGGCHREKTGGGVGNGN